MKALGSVLVLLCLAGGLAACGGGEATTETQEAQESAAEAERETLELKKETAEREAEKAKAEARKEAKRAQRAAAESEPEPEPEPEPEAETAEVPNVVGMRLPAARSTLKAAGYRTQAENTDTSFGIVIPSHFTVCEQSEPHGKVVTVLAQKYGC